MISAHEKMMETIPKEFKRIMSGVEAAVRSGKTRYLISSRHLKPEYERNHLLGFLILLNYENVLI